MARKKSSKPAKKQSGNQAWSIILFACGILLFLLALVEGESAWFFIHNLLFGLFGASAFILPAVVIYAAFMVALDKSGKAVAGKVIEGFVLVLLASAVVQIIFVGNVDGKNFLDKLIKLYKDGSELNGGGLFSALLGWPLLALFQKTGATIIVLLLSFVVIMLLANISLIDFVGFFYKPIRGIKDAVKQAHEEDFKLPPGARRFENEKMEVFLNFFDLFGLM